MKNGSFLSEWLEIIPVVPQGPILGPILFNIFINSSLLFIKETDICNFVDGTNLCRRGRDLHIVSENLEMDANIAINWLNNNEMVPNPKNFQFLFLARNKSIKKEMPFVGKPTKFSSTSITLDKTLNFKSHIENIAAKQIKKQKLFSEFEVFLHSKSKSFSRAIYIIKL